MRPSTVAYMIGLFVLPVLLLSAQASALPCNGQQCDAVLSLNLSQEQKKELLSSTVYPWVFYPNHTFVREWNLAVEVDRAPDRVPVYAGRWIKDTWLVLLALMPSVLENDTLLVPDRTSALSEYHYRVEIPPNYYAGRYPDTSQGDCRREYFKTREEARFALFRNGEWIGSSTLQAVRVFQAQNEFRNRLDIAVDVRINHYRWYRYCCQWDNKGCKKWCYQCKYRWSELVPDRLHLEDAKTAQHDPAIPAANMQVLDTYHGTLKGALIATDYAALEFNLSNASYAHYQKTYDLVFDYTPFYIATLRARSTNHTRMRNLFFVNHTFYTPVLQNCTLRAWNHFYQLNQTCTFSSPPQQLSQPLAKTQNDSNSLQLVLRIAVVFGLLYLLYRLVKPILRKKLAVLGLSVLVLLPISAFAAEGTECGITNLGTCLVQNFFEYIGSLINAPIEGLLLIAKLLITSPAGVELFKPIWAVVAGAFSIFYTLILLFAGFKFITSGFDAEQRENAKTWLKNALLIIVFVGASYFLYTLALDLSVAITNWILELIDPAFFKLTADSVVNFALQLVFGIVYLLALVLVIFTLLFRFILVSTGVLIFPIGILLYFIPPTQGFGKAILNVLLALIFVPFFEALVLLAGSMLITVSFFEHIKILIVIATFFLVYFINAKVVSFAMQKAAALGLNDLKTAFSGVKASVIAVTKAAKFAAV